MAGGSEAQGGSGSSGAAGAGWLPLPALVAILALCLWPLAGAAEDGAASERATWSAIWENDVFGGTDRNYTNGLRLSYMSPAATAAPSSTAAGRSVDPPHRWLARHLLGADGLDTVRHGLALGHSIFTPEDIDVAGPLPDQHPYAGLLYLEYALYAQDEESLRMAALQVGLVGPSAGAEWVQNSVHRVIDSTHAAGWDNQLHDEPVFALYLERRERALLARDFLGREYDLTPHWGLSLGTLRTQAKAGVTLRYGPDLPNDYGPPRIRPALGGAGFFQAARGFRWYLFAGLDVRAVARDLMLDGNTFRESASVSRTPLVADFQAGLVLSRGNAQLAYTFVTRTREFASQRDAQQFGSLSLSVKF